MNSLHDDVKAFGREPRTIADLARACSLGSDDIAASAFDVAIPAVVEGLEAAVASPADADKIHSLIVQLRRSERSEPQHLLGSIGHPLGKIAVERIFGRDLPSVQEDVAVAAGIGSADRLLQNTSLACLAVAAGSELTPYDLASFVAVVTGAPVELSAAPDPAISVSAADVSATKPTPPSDDAPLESSNGPTERVPAVAITYAGSEAGTLAPPSADDPPAAVPPPVVQPDETGDPKRRTGLIVAALAAFLLGGFVLGRAFDGDSTSNLTTGDSVPESAPGSLADATADEADTEPGAGDEDPAVPEEAPVEEDPVDGLEVDESQATDAPVSDGSVGGGTDPETDGEAGAIDLVALVDDPLVEAMSIPLRDITDPERDASGVVEFRLNRVTGEICYGVSSIGIAGPYASHIHVGEFGERGGIVVELGQLENGDVRCVENEPVDTRAILADPANHYAELHDPNDEWTIRGQLSERIDGDVISLRVAMTDDRSSDSNEIGYVDFELNMFSGEICYTVNAVAAEGPFGSRIHAGPAGIDGPILAELGTAEVGETSCVPNDPADTNSIVNDPASYHAVLEPQGEGAGGRNPSGQFSETVSPSTTPTFLDDAAAPRVDADGGGARVEVEQGTFYLRGEVADQATADRFVEDWSGIGDTPLVDELVVVEGAPLPSGRIVIADAIFFDTDAVDVGVVDGPTVAAIFSLVDSQPGAVLTVVGHTDDRGPDVINLQLSLQRATSVRDLLANLGLPDEQLRIRGAGETSPIGDNTTPEGRAANRRIEFEFAPA